MLDDSFCLKSLILVQKIRIEFPNVPMPESLSGSLVWWWSYKHNHVHAYVIEACGQFIV